MTADRKKTTTAGAAKKRKQPPVKYPTFAAAVAAGAHLGAHDTPYADVPLDDWAAHFGALSSAALFGTSPDKPDGPRPTDLPAVGRLVLTDEQVRHTAAVLLATGVPEYLDRRIAAGRTKPGRPPRFSSLSVLVALWACATNNRPTHLKEAAQILTHGISAAARTVLGVNAETLRVPVACLDDRPAARKGRGAQQDTLVDDKAAERALGRAFARIVGQVDPSNLPKNRRLTHEELAAVIRPVDEATRRARQGDLDWVANQLVQASWRMLPRWLRRQYRGSACIDATPIPLNSRRSTKHRSSADPDGGLYLRRNEWTGEIVKRVHALDAHVAAAADDHPGDLGHFPAMVMGFTTERPGVDPAGASRRVLAAIQAGGMGPTRGHPGWLAGDRLYTNLTTTGYQRPAAEHHWNVVHEYQDNQLGLQGGHKGMAMVEGGWYCPAMLQHEELLTASARWRAKDITWDQYQQLIKDRTAYGMRTKTKATDSAPERLRCPAAGKDATATCKLKKTHDRPTLQADGARVDVRLEIQPEGPAFAGGSPDVCKHDSVSVTPEHTPKYAQRHLYGTQEFGDLYRLLRASQEGLHGQGKDGSKEAFAVPSRRRVRGKVAQTLMLAFLFAAYNIRKITTFLAESVDDPATGHKVVLKNRQVRLDPWAKPAEDPDDPPDDEDDQKSPDAFVAVLDGVPRPGARGSPAGRPSPS